MFNSIRDLNRRCTVSLEGVSGHRHVAGILENRKDYVLKVKINIDVTMRWRIIIRRG